jgi:hypothetical protein
MMVLLSIVPMLPACIYLFAPQTHVTPHQRALQVPQLIFLLASIGHGIHAVRTYKLQRLEIQVDVATVIDVRPRAFHCVSGE